MTDHLSFQAYLAKRRVTDTPAGDFTKDARNDDAMTRMESWPQLQAYLMRRHAARPAVAAAKQVWAGYQVARRTARNSHVRPHGRKKAQKSR